MVTVYRIPQSTTTQVITPACMVWTPAPVPAVYATGVVPGAVHSLAAHAAPAAAISTQLHGPMVTGTLLSPVATSVATPAQAFRSPRKTQPQQLAEPPSTPSGASGGAASSGGPVSVAGRSFERLRELGKGSFGVVWEVQEAGDAKGSSGTLALKCSKPANQQMLEACLFEAEVLQKLAAALPAEVAEDNRVPRYVAHCMTTTAATASPTGSLSGAGVAALTGQSQVLVAMSKLEGRPLDQWLYGVDENRLKTVAVSQVLEGPFPDGLFGTQDLGGTCQLVLELIGQMAPIFAPLDGIAYHRDVSAHNFLIRGEVGQAHFSLLDFGLAVRASTWQQEFQSRNISGDPRYFTPAAWMLMVYGHKYLEAHPDASFLQQYKSRLDHYSFGLLILEVFFGLWQGPAAEAAAADEAPAAAASTKALAKVRKAWHGLWGDAMGFFQMFHGKGFAATREALARSQAVSKYADKLRTLCSELRLATEAFAGARDGGPAAAVLGVAAGLVDPRAKLAWRDVPELLRRAAPRRRLGVRGAAAVEVDQLAEATPTSATTSGATEESSAASPVSDSGTSAGKTTAAEEVAADTASGDEAGHKAAASEPSSAQPEAAAGGAIAASKPEEAAVGAAPNSVDEPKASDAANSAEDAAAADPKPQRPTRMFSHRRNWTVDEAVSLTRGVPEVAMGWAVVPPEPAAASTN